jgi:hypothetical protein
MSFEEPMTGSGLKQTNMFNHILSKHKAYGCECRREQKKRVCIEMLHTRLVIIQYLSYQYVELMLKEAKAPLAS